mgnify:CR=1 FL=1
MLITHSKLFVIAIFFLCLTTACIDRVVVGGKCEYTDEKLLVRVVGNENSRVELEPVYGDEIIMSVDEFDSPVLLNDYYELSIRHHTSGGCNPYSIRHKEKLVKSNVVLGLTEQQTYAAMFILDGTRNCANGLISESCRDDLALDSSFDVSQLSQLIHLEPRRVSHCSAAMIHSIWPEIESSATQTRLISCVGDLNGGERAVEFSLSEDESRLLLRKVY